MADIKIIVDSSDVATATNRVDQLGSSGTVAQKGIDKAARGMNQFGAVAKNGGKKLNTFNMQIQQGGYQLQDFVVQLQSGTSFFTAFGQQGSQFAGVFGPQGAVIGAVIAIGAAVGGMAYKMLTAGEDVREFQEILEDTTDILDKLTRATEAAAMSNEELEKSFGNASTEIKSTLALLREIAKSEAQRAIDDLAASLTKLYEVSGDGERRGGIAAFFDVNIMMAFTRAGKAAVKEARLLTGEFLNAQDALAASEGNLEGQIAATQRLLSATKTLSDLDGERSEEEDKLIKQISESLLKMQETQTVKKTTLSTYQDILGTEKGLALEVEALNKLFEDRLGTIDDTANLYEDIIGSSKGLAQAEAALNKIFGDRLGTIDDTANLYKDILGSSLGLYQSEMALNKLFEDRLGTIDDTANNYEDILGSSEGLLNAESALNKLFEDSRGTIDDTANLYEDILGSAEGLLEAEQALNEIYSKRPTQIERLAGLSDEQYQQLLYSQAYAQSRMDAPKTPVKAKKEPAVKESDLSKLQKQLDLEDALLGKTEARQRVIQALGVDFVKNNPKTVAGLEEQINKNLELVRVEQQRIDLANTIGSAMEDSLMSMVDGTKSVKDAFRDMAADIVRHLYKVLVVQQMINAIGGAIGGPIGNALSTYGQADGGAWQGGSQIKAYADGGVVGSPTLFPMAGGKTGLMGEAGPEAIMPLKRGANGKLGVQMEGGGGDNVVINQSFNFQANGDDSVKKIIAQAAPQIAQMTKNSMLNDRRRGGTTKAVFG
jgi:hypothetical protein